MRNFNSSREPRECGPLLGWALVLFIAVCTIDRGAALDPGNLTSQYKTDYWSAENGFPGGHITSIAQTPDGYLWIGTDTGLVRFDGLNFLLIRQTESGETPLTDILGLATDDDGDLWAQTQNLLLVRAHHVAFGSRAPDAQLQIDAVTVVCPDLQGGVLMSSLTRGILRYKNGKLESLVGPEALSRSITLSIAETPDGKVWAGTRDDGLRSFDSRGATSIKKGLPDMKINTLLPSGDGGLWIGTDNGVARWDGARVVESGIPPSLRHVQVLTMERDRDGNMWVGTKGGLVRLNNAGAAMAKTRSAPAGRQTPGRQISVIFEDREGNIWVGDGEGLERIRDSPFVTYTTADGLPSESNGPIYIGPQGRLWVAPTTGGLWWMKGGKVGQIKNEGVANDVIYSIAGNRNDVWIGRQTGGLTHLFAHGDAFDAETYTRADGLAQNSVYSVRVEHDGTVWAGTLNGGVTQLKDGRFKTYTAADGLASNAITSIEDGQGGSMWFGTSRGLSEWSKGHWRSFTVRDGLPSLEVISLLKDSSGILWIGTTNGLSFLSSDRTHISGFAPQLLREPVFGMAEDLSGYLWISTSSHVLRASRERLLSGHLEAGDIREYGIAQGLQGSGGVRRDRSVIADDRGKLWFSMNRGISVTDPGRDETAPAIVQVDAITTDGSPVALRPQVRLPASQQRIVIHYAGLSLGAPDRVRFRYRLDGFDHEWSDPVATREAVYTNLGPGSYTFRLLASNGSGLWNGSEVSMPFTIAPAYWQTWWFRALCVLALAGLTWVIYWLRLRQMSRQMNLRFDERLAERMRIAHELHDTLLQGFLSASMQLYVASNQVPENSPAKPKLGRVLQLMSEVTEEGRNALRGLRTSTNDSQALEEALSLVPQELALQEEPAFRVIVEGASRALHPVIRDEVYRIGREALVNAFRHSNAEGIEVELEYATRYFRVMVRDNGRGIDDEVLHSGREGHWGLAGMRERADGIGARLRVMSRAEAGTEVELTVPGSVAYQQRAGRSLPRWLVRLYPRRANRRNPKGDQRS